MYRLTLHGEAGIGRVARPVEEKIVQAFESFIATVEQIAGHGVYLAQFEGATGFHRHRGEDQTMVETPVVEEGPLDLVARPFTVEQAVATPPPIAPEAS
jgi:hypothetical protein